MIDNNSFASRHIGPRNNDIKNMLNVVGCDTLDHLIEKTVPKNKTRKHQNKSDLWWIEGTCNITGTRRRKQRVRT